MPKRIGTANVVTTTRQYKGQVYRTHLLRRSYREGGQYCRAGAGLAAPGPPSDPWPTSPRRAGDQPGWTVPSSEAAGPAVLGVGVQSPCGRGTTIPLGRGQSYGTRRSNNWSFLWPPAPTGRVTSSCLWSPTQSPFTRRQARRHGVRSNTINWKTGNG
jgi:hypothetical protein